MDEKVEEKVGAEAQASQPGTGAPQPAKRKSKKLKVVGIVVGVIVILGIGMFVWHNDPSFCGTVCHTSMSTYTDTYNAQADQPATDKWGNEVSNASAMLVVSHRESGKACLDCHVPSISQQLGEVVETITGNYYYPLEEATAADLLYNAGNSIEGDPKGDAFCLKSGCHVNADGSDLTRADLTERTSDRARNPHAWEHAENACTDCHKSHRASVVICTECHSDVEIPDGWVDAETGEEIHKKIYA